MGLLVGAFMEAFLLNTLLGFLIAILIFMFFRLELCHKSLIFTLRESKNELISELNQSEFEIGEDLMADFKDDLKETVLELIGQMRTPTAIDHLAGVAANIFQMREQWRITKEQNELNTMISASHDGDDYGAP